MRRDLQSWDQAVKLARALSPEQVPEISLEYARQLEHMYAYLCHCDPFLIVKMCSVSISTVKDSQFAKWRNSCKTYIHLYSVSSYV